MALHLVPAENQHIFHHVSTDGLQTGTSLKQLQKVLVSICLEGSSASVSDE